MASRTVCPDCGAITVIGALDDEKDVLYAPCVLCAIGFKLNANAEDSIYEGCEQ